MLEGRKVLFTYHSTQRIEEFRMTVDQAREMLEHATKERPPKDQRKYKQWKYKTQAYYYRSGTVLFTLVDKEVNGEMCFLVLSVYDQRMDLSARQLDI